MLLERSLDAVLSCSTVSIGGKRDQFTSTAGGAHSLIVVEHPARTVSTGRRYETFLGT